jgi:hypothetical protein
MKEKNHHVLNFSNFLNIHFHGDPDLIHFLKQISDLSVDQNIPNETFVEFRRAVEDSIKFQSDSDVKLTWEAAEKQIGVQEKIEKMRVVPISQLALFEINVQIQELMEHIKQVSEENKLLKDQLNQTNEMLQEQLENARAREVVILELKQAERDKKLETQLQDQALLIQQLQIENEQLKQEKRDLPVTTSTMAIDFSAARESFNASNSSRPNDVIQPSGLFFMERDIEKQNLKSEVGAANNSKKHQKNLTI